MLRPDPDTCELVLTSLHPGVTAEQAIAATGWPLRVADDVSTTDAARRSSSCRRCGHSQAA